MSKAQDAKKTEKKVALKSPKEKKEAKKLKKERPSASKCNDRVSSRYTADGSVETTIRHGSSRHHVVAAL